jgi:radical SAM-linked protein
VATRFAIQGDLRFISHHDTMRLFERALSRAQLPVKFSEGFNPRPKLSLPLPRTVGLASEVDLFVVELDQTIEPNEVLHKLGQQMPEGITLLESWLLPDSRPPQAELVEYQLGLPDKLLADVSEKVARILASPTWIIGRDSAQGKGEKSIDLRAYLHDAAIKEQNLCWSVRVTNRGTVRPIEMLAAVGLDVEEWHHRVRRTAVHWSTPLPGEVADSMTT